MPGDESYDDEHERLRARLAAEPAPPMPADVATRLHDVLAEESRQRAAGTAPAEPTETATVTPLRRRGRWRAPLLAAAAAVAVVAIAVPVVDQVSGGGSDSGTSSSDAGSSTLADGATEREGQAPDADAAPQATVDRPELTRSAFRADVREKLADRDLAPGSAASFRTAVECRSGVPSTKVGVPVTLDRDPAVVLSSRSRGVVPGTEVRAVVCGPDGPEVAARTTLPDRR